MSPEKTGIKETPKMRRVEERFGYGGETIKDILTGFYWASDSETVATTAAAIDVSAQTVFQWMRTHDVPRRPCPFVNGWPENKNNRTTLERMRANWQDPRKRAQMLDRIQSDAAKLRRSSSVKAWHQTHPEKAAEMYVKTGQGNRLVTQRRMAVALGTDHPEQALRSLAEQGLSISGIAVICSRSYQTTQSWLTRAGAATGRASSLGLETIEQRSGLWQLATEADLIRFLKPNYQTVMHLLYDHNRQTTTLDQAAKERKITRERVRKIEDTSFIIIEKMLAGELIPKNGVATRRVIGRATRVVQGKIDKALDGNPKETLEELIYRQGLTVEEVAGEIGCSPMSLYYKMRKLGINQRVRQESAWMEKLGPDPEQTLRDWYQQGGLRGIAARLGSTVSIAIRLMEDYGISRKRGRLETSV